MKLGIIEWVLSYEDEIKRAVKDKRLDAGYANNSYTVGGRTNKISDVTGNTAVHNIMPVACVTVFYGIGRSILLRNPEKWLKMIEIVQFYYSDTIQGDLIEMLWKQKLSIAEITEALRVKRPMLYVMRSDVLSFAYGVASGLGLIRIKKQDANTPVA